MATRQYVRKTKMLGLNAFQRDIVLVAIKREIELVRNNKEIPQSLRMLALEQLVPVMDTLEEWNSESENSQ